MFFMMICSSNGRARCFKSKQVFCCFTRSPTCSFIYKREKLSIETTQWPAFPSRVFLSLKIFRSAFAFVKTSPMPFDKRVVQVARQDHRALSFFDVFGIFRFHHLTRLLLFPHLLDAHYLENRLQLRPLDHFLLQQELGKLFQR